MNIDHLCAGRGAIEAGVEKATVYCILIVH